MFTTIEIEQDKAVARVVLSRPEQHNAFTPTMVAELTESFRQLGQAEGVRVVVLTGRGPSFCAGADLSFMRAAADYTFEQNVTDGQAIFDLMMAVDSCSRPVIGRVNGLAIGGGVGLMACCDVVVAVERARFALSEARLGIVPAVISPFVLSKIGVSSGRELFLTGERFDAYHAQRLGLVHHVVPDDSQLEAKVEERIQQLLQAAPQAQTIIKELIRTAAGQPKAAMRDFTTALIAQRRASPEGREGMSAFLEKRKPFWQSPS